jgi:hypothetical protein
MGGIRKLASSVALVLVALIVAAGCGSSGSDPTGSSGTKEETVDWSIYPSGPARQFIVPGKDNAVPTFGWEATPAERKEVTALVAAWMRARAAKDLGKDCSYLSRKYSAYITRDARGVSDGKVKTCPQALAFFGKEVSGNYGNTFGNGPVVSLRINRTHGYALYHGNNGNDYVVAVDKEGGKWKIAIGMPLGRFA